jgi:hypothetical protein
MWYAILILLILWISSQLGTEAAHKMILSQLCPAGIGSKLRSMLLLILNTEQIYLN